MMLWMPAVALGCRPDCPAFCPGRVRVRSGLPRRRFPLRRLGLGRCVWCPGPFGANVLLEPTEGPETNTNKSYKAKTVRLVPSRPTLSTCLSWGFLPLEKNH